MVVLMNSSICWSEVSLLSLLVEIEFIAGDQQKRVVRGFKALPYNIPRGSIGAYYPETNPLLPLAYHDPKSKAPTAKSIPVVVRSQPAGEMPDHKAVATPTRPRRGSFAEAG